MGYDPNDSDGLLLLAGYLILSAGSRVSCEIYSLLDYYVVHGSE